MKAPAKSNLKAHGPKTEVNANAYLQGNRVAGTPPRILSKFRNNGSGVGGEFCEDGHHPPPTPLPLLPGIPFDKPFSPTKSKKTNKNQAKPLKTNEKLKERRGGDPGGPRAPQPPLFS